MRSIAALFVLVIGPIAFASDIENPKVWSPNGEICLVARQYPRLGDFDRMSSDEYWRTDPIDEWLAQYPLQAPPPPPPPEPVVVALYRRWPSGNHELLSEFTFETPFVPQGLLVTNDAFVIEHEGVRCEKDAELLTIRAQDGSIVRTIKTADVLTRNDQQWLCRGSAMDMRWSPEEVALRGTVLVTDTKWDDPTSRFAVVEIDVPDGDIAPPERDLCPAAVPVDVVLDDGLWRPRERITDDAMPLDSATLLARATHREIPEYPLIATKARIMGDVHVRVVVDSAGNVESAIVQPLPFGIDQSVRDAIAKWTFQPGERFAGWLVFRFRIVRNVRIETTPIS